MTPIDDPDSRRPRRRLAGTRFPLWFAATESVRAALGSIRAHGFRSFLTTLGIVIGVASVIGMVSIIHGLSFATRVLSEPMLVVKASKDELAELIENRTTGSA